MVTRVFWIGGAKLLLGGSSDVLDDSYAVAMVLWEVCQSKAM